MEDTETFAAHISARVRAMKSTLMQRPELDSLVDKDKVEAMVEVLLASSYEEEMAEALTRYAGADAIEDAVSRNLVNTFSKLLRTCRGPLEDLARIFVNRWDLMSVKALLRNRHHQLDAETGQASLVPGPTMSVALQRELASQDTMEALVQGLVAWNSRLCGGLANALGDYNEGRNLRILEEALDQGYFVRNIIRLTAIGSEDSEFIRQLLRMEIDRINLRIVFEPKQPGEDTEDRVRRFLPKGALSLALLRDMAASATPERAVDALEKTPYGELAEGLAALAQTGRFSRLDRQFELAFLNRLRLASQRNVLSIAVLMRYAWLKYNEVINIRMISRGASVNLPKSRIREELIHA